MNEDIKQKIREINRRDDISISEKNELISEVIYNKNTKTYNLIICDHYDRNCLLECPKCLKFYQCRLCHDEHEDHKIDRFSVKNIKCKLCKTVQPPSNKCKKCLIEMAYYYCSICNLYDNDEKKIIKHCEFCGICRIGINKHCHKCDMCFPITCSEHKCVDKKKYDDKCTICHVLKQELKNMRVLKCEHLSHETCINDYIKAGKYQCPLCRKSLMDMTYFWKQIEEYVSNCKMPEQKKVEIICNDCEKKSITDYHYLYHKCQHCEGWNTDIVNNIE